MVRLKPKKKDRVVQVIQTVAQVEEMFEEQEEIELFRQQLAPNVYKIWPVEPIPPGEYAVIEFTPGEANIRVWDFTCLCRPTAGEAGTAESEPDSAGGSGR